MRTNQSNKSFGKWVAMWHQTAFSYAVNEYFFC